MSKILFASVISEIEQSDIFMTVKARICETPAANLNGARVTEAFIDEIVSNNRYVGLPLYADVKALTNGQYRRLGHLYDAKTGEFHSTQIGSFYQFEKEEFDGGSYLVGYARIPKRNKKLSHAISELFADGALKFSFEVTVGEQQNLDDGTLLIDASEHNFLEGTAIVSYPACEDAVALELVAQQADEEGDENMAEAKETVVAEEAVQAETTEPEVAEVNETENAAVLIRESEEQRHAVTAYDTETGKEVTQVVTVETFSTDVQEGNLVETTDGLHVAETVIAEPGEDSGESGETGTDPQEQTQDEPVVEPAQDETGDESSNEDDPESAADDPAPDSTEKKKTAEQIEKSASEQIAELIELVNGLKNEIAELKESKQTAETKVTAEINPFVDDLSVGKKYSLLQKEDRKNTYSLLSK